MNGADRPDVVPSPLADPGVFPQATTKPVARRLDLPLQEIGLFPPPTVVHLGVHGPQEAKWTFVARSSPGQAEEVARWFSQWSPASIRVETGLAPKKVEVTFDILEDPWDGLLADRCVRTLVLTPEGTACLVVEAEASAVQGFIRRMRERLGDKVNVRPHYGQNNLNRVVLTMRQTEVIFLAVALGYYEIPRRIDLRALAKKMDLSLGATSEVIRRGEATIISSYIDSLISNAGKS